MNLLNKNKMLSQAKKSFSKSNYKTALETFSVVLQTNPDSKEAHNFVILSEMALSGEGGAEALFDYYEILRDEDKETADTIMGDILQTMDGTLDKLNELLSDPFLEKLEYEDGILYRDFKDIVLQNQDFHKTFENIMFSTRVIITGKDDFLEFLEDLIENGFAQMALSYLENALALHPSDELLKKLLINLQKESKN